MEKKEIEKIVKKHTMIHFPHIHPYVVMDFEQGLIEALNQALSMPGVVGRSEQLKAFLDYVDSRYSEQGTRDKIVDEFLSL